MPGTMITKYCLKVKFEGFDSDTFFEVDHREFERLKGLWPKLSESRYFAFFRTSDGTEVVLNADRVETLRFTKDQSLEEIPALMSVREEEWVLKYQMYGRREPEYLTLSSPAAAVDFLDATREAFGSGVSAPLFLSIADGVGESTCLGREKLLYLAAPKRVVDEGRRRA